MNNTENNNILPIEQAVKNMVESYMHKYYGITLDELNAFYGLKLCKYLTHIKEYDMEFIDAYGSQTVQFVSNELNANSNYDYSNIDFEPGDVVIDIGANIGMVSIYLAKRYPFLKIYSYEPVKMNFENLNRNIAENKIPNGIITTERFAVNGDGSPVTLMSCIGNSGGSKVGEIAAAGCVIKAEDRDVPGITLPEIIQKHGIKKVKLLKIDCENCEYDILKKCPPEILEKIENLRGEFHEEFDKTGGKEIEKLIKHCKKHIENVDVVKYNLSKKF